VDESVLVRASAPPDAVVPWGPGVDDVADVRLGADDRPLLLVLHGGFWRPAYDRSHLGPMTEALNAAGWTVAAPEWRRMSHPRPPAPTPRHPRRAPPGRLRRVRGLGPAARRSPSSPTSASTRCSTAARSRPASRSATATRSSSTRTWAWSPRSSTRRRWSLQGHVAIGHCRYSTTGRACGRTPSRPSAPRRTGHVALGHNGNLTNTHELPPGRRAGRPAASSARRRRELHHRHRPAHRPARRAPRRLARGAAMEELPLLRGAFSLVFMDDTPCTPPATRRASARWSSAKLERGWVVASETAALDIVGASFVREVEPGELIAIDEHGLRSQRFAEAEPKGCLFEFVYLARPDTTDQRPQRARRARVEIGRQLAASTRSRPTSSSPSRSPAPRRRRLRPGVGHPLRPGPGEERLRRPHVHPAVADDPPARHPAQAQPAARGHRGKRLVVVDDSIVRGNTQRALVRMLREAGAPRCTCASPARR
jgi:hypothetical protein